MADDKIQVRAVKGRLCPWAPPRGGYVGYTRVRDGETADHEVPGFGGLKRETGLVEVPNTAYYRRALESKDLAYPDAPEESDERESPTPPASTPDLPNALRAESEDKS